MKNPVTGRFIKNTILYINPYNGEEYDGNKLPNEEVFSLCLQTAQNLPLVQYYTPERLNVLFELAYKNKVASSIVLLNLHSWALYNIGKSEHKPPYFVTSLNDFKTLY